MSDPAAVITPITVPEISFCDPPDMPEPHEPPIGFEEGSLSMLFPANIRQDRIAGGDPRPYKYALESKAYGPVAIVRTYNETNTGKINLKKYSVPSAMGCQLLVFLHQLKEVPTPPLPFEYEPKSADSQILIKGGPFLLESDRQLQGPTETFKFQRRFRYRHPGYSRHFRIAGWMIVNSAFQPVYENNDPSKTRFEAFDRDGLKLYVSFHHA